MPTILSTVQHSCSQVSWLANAILLLMISMMMLVRMMMMMITTPHKYQGRKTLSGDDTSF